MCKFGIHFDFPCDPICAHSPGPVVEGLASESQSRESKLPQSNVCAPCDDGAEDTESSDGVSEQLSSRARVTQEEKRERAKLRQRAWRERKRRLRSSLVAMPADPSGSVFGPGEEGAYCFEA